jgi:AcrR family transcriptional regulator
MSTAPATPPHRQGRPQKRSVVLEGASVVFARNGYARASIDDIAAAAGVSTRTIYNHFPDKAALFHEVITTSATLVADAQIAVMDQHLAPMPSDSATLENALVRFGLAWLAPVPEHQTHFNLVRHVNADLAHIPPHAVKAWQEAGPNRVLRALAGHIRQFGERGLLAVEAPDRAALQFACLIAPTNPALPHVRPAGFSPEEMVTAGVRLFLHGLLPERRTAGARPADP